MIGANFKEFSDLNLNVDGEDGKNYCFEFWYLQYIKSISLFFISSSAVFINEFVADFYQQLGKFQKKHTKIEE